MTTLQAPAVIDIAGTTLNADDRRRLRHPLTGGLILFARNWEQRRQLTELCAQIKSIRPDVLICVDHEGGRVQRFRTDGFTHLSPMRAFGELWRQDTAGVPGSGAMRAGDAASAAGYVLGANELAVFNSRRARVPKRGIIYLATRFSAKEAFSKAIGMGLRMPMTWRACEIVNAYSGKPTIQLNGALAEWFAQRRLIAHVSLSDESDYAAAFVVVETMETT